MIVLTTFASLTLLQSPSGNLHIQTPSGRIKPYHSVNLPPDAHAHFEEAISDHFLLSRLLTHQPHED